MRIISALRLFFICIICLPAAAFAQTYEAIKDEYVIVRHPTPYGSATVASSNSNYQTVKRGQFHSLVRPRTAAAALQSSGPSKEIVLVKDEDVKRECAALMAADPTIKSCEANSIMKNEVWPNDPHIGTNVFFQDYRRAHYLEGADYNNLFDMSSFYGWDKINSAESVVVGITDSGTNYLHPDLIPNLWQNPGETADNGKDDDGNGYIDDIIGINAMDPSIKPGDCNGHGSHCAGIVGARGNNGIGIAGVAWNVKILTARNAIDCGPSVSIDAVITGMEYIWDLKANRGINIKVLNGSFGGNTDSPAQRAAIAKLGSVDIVFVAAAGNDGLNIDSSPRYPAAFDNANMVVVANMNTYDSFFGHQLNESSNRGPIAVDISAPGTEIYSTLFPNDPNTVNGSGNETYGFKTGTSMAAPMVSGALALLAAQRPHYNTHRALITHLLENSWPAASTQGLTKTGKMLNLYTLLNAPDIADACPSDPKKIDPGPCGCGVVDSYKDSDGDSTADCTDGCPNDNGKLAPGTCGCGVSDANTDGDSLIDCQDGCPTDAAKTTPGTCGCGVSDSPEANGQLSCVNQNINSVTPKKPKAGIAKGKIAVSMGKRSDPGIKYVATMTWGSRKKPKTKTIQSDKPIIKFKLPPGGKATITYHYVLGSFSSAESGAKKITF